MRTLVLNYNNLVQDGQNNKMVYRFPNSVLFDKHYLAFAACSMYYSWFNISAELKNNTFTYNWQSGSTFTTYTITIPDGLYEVNILNQLLQFNFITNGHYLVDANGLNVYYAEFQINEPRYAVQINTYLVPTALPAGWTNPASLVFPTGNTFNPQITLPSLFNNILGFPAGFQTYQNINNPAGVPATTNYVSKLANGTISYISTSPPNIQPNSSILFSISNIDNAYAQPTSIIYTLVPNVGVGEIINERPPNFIWNKLIPGTYNELRLTILGTDLQPIKINDPSMTIVLVIKDKSESE
jgi:hypothetical protein